MGFLSNIFGSSPPSDIEISLKIIYIPLLQSTTGMSYSQSKSTFMDILKMVKEESRTEKTILPSGNFMLENETTNPQFQKLLNIKRKEGVRNEDIRWWWSLHDYERRMMHKYDDLCEFALFLKYTKGDKLTQKESIKLVRKYHPFYGDPEDTTNTNGNDRPIPWELKDRVNKYVERRSFFELDNFKKDMDTSSSFNSLIRKEIQNGNL